MTKITNVAAVMAALLFPLLAWSGVAAAFETGDIIAEYKAAVNSGDASAVRLYGNAKSECTSMNSLPSEIQKCKDSLPPPPQRPVCGNGKAEAGEQCGEPGLSCPAGQRCVGCKKCVPTTTCPPGSTPITRGPDKGKCRSGDCVFTIEQGIESCYKCGNKILEPNEECEDGNTTNGDGCSSECRREACPPVGWPWWLWLIIFGGGALVLATLVYFLFLRRKGGGGAGGGAGSGPSTVGGGGAGGGGKKKPPVTRVEEPEDDEPPVKPEGAKPGKIKPRTVVQTEPEPEAGEEGEGEAAKPDPEPEPPEGGDEGEGGDDDDEPPPPDPAPRPLRRPDVKPPVAKPTVATPQKPPVAKPTVAKPAAAPPAGAPPATPLRRDRGVPVAIRPMGNKPK